MDSLVVDFKFFSSINYHVISIDKDFKKNLNKINFQIILLS